MDTDACWFLCYCSMSRGCDGCIGKTVTAQEVLGILTSVEDRVQICTIPLQLLLSLDLDYSWHILSLSLWDWWWQASFYQLWTSLHTEGSSLGHPSRMGWMRKDWCITCRQSVSFTLLCQTTGSLNQDATLISSSGTPQLFHIQTLRVPQLQFWLQNIFPAPNSAAVNSLMVMWSMVSGATSSLRWEGPPWGKANKKVSQAWKCFCGSWDRNFSRTHPLPAIPPHCLVKLKHSSSNSRQVSSLHHPGIDTPADGNWVIKTKMLALLEDSPWLPVWVLCQSPPCSISASHLFPWQSGICLLWQRHFTSHVFSLHGRQRNSRAAFLSNPTPLTARTGRKQQLLCVWIKPSCYLLLPADISLDSKRIFKFQWQGGLSSTKDSALQIAHGIQQGTNWVAACLQRLLSWEGKPPQISCDWVPLHSLSFSRHFGSDTVHTQWPMLVSSISCCWDRLSCQPAQRVGQPAVAFVWVLGRIGFWQRERLGIPVSNAFTYPAPLKGDSRDSSKSPLRDGDAHQLPKTLQLPFFIAVSALLSLCLPQCSQHRAAQGHDASD